jgi:hypothetical protein
MLQNWMNTVASTTNPETLSNLLTVIYGNMQQRDITNNLLSKLDFTARLVTIISNRSLPLSVCVCVCVCVCRDETHFFLNAMPVARSPPLSLHRFFF